jgi:hypothetical protein
MRNSKSILSLVIICAMSFGCETDETSGDDPGGPSSGIIPDEAVGDQEKAICARTSVDLEMTTPTVALLVDQSGSMTSSFGNTSRWNAVYATLMDPQYGVVASLEEAVRFGFFAYSSDDGFQGGQCPVMETVAPALSSYDAIDSAYAVLSPRGDTPTGPSIGVAHAALSSDVEPGPHVIVLATDGMPDTCDVPDPDGLPGAQAESVAATEAAFQAGIDTYVISVGPEIAEPHLQDLANAGAGVGSGDVGAAYYVALNPGELVDAFERIINGVRFCVFPLESDVILGGAEGFRLGEGTVLLDGTRLEQGVDWRLRGESSVELLGSACDEILDGGDHAVVAKFTCEAIML